uniref:RNA-directed DNA polymerase, eukaryota n=1 Tax=Tanacetum cinerariifolium TaxID=118510 RepID=A0A6L2NVW3_TANCI|nr:RNA-directed DNA polymerase, eukaryota [Tanacetum cinerariifolium]
MGAHNKNSLQSKADQTVRISKSVFVSNFPEGCTAKDLWKVCNDYGTVVDVFIPNKKSKVGKRFAFVRFIKVINLDRLIENFNTIWIGRFHLVANLVHFERPKKPNLSSHNNAVAASSYPRGVDQAKVLVFDDSCVAERDLSNHVMGNVKDVSSISNLRTLIMEEGFSVVNLVYLGENGSSPVGVHGPSISSASVFVLDDSYVAERDLSNHVMGNVKDDSSISNLRTLFMEEGFSVVNLVDIEAIPLNVWSRETFTRIGKKWGEALDSEDNVYMVRAKELFTWSPIFLGQNEMEYTSDEDSDVGPQKVPDRLQFCEEGPNDDRVSDVEEVLETNFGDNSSIPINHIDELEKQQSEDPFKIYRLLRKQPGDESQEVSSSLSHPPGFTPDVSVIRNKNGQSAKEILVVVNAKVMNNSQDVYKEASCDNVDPNQVYHKRLLWDYVSTLIDRWNGEVVILGDFNEVWNIDEMCGSCFNPTSARVFDQFISASGLVDVKMEGYMFTWSYPSGSKMSKLDRFLVSEGIFSIFPSITVVCLDRHLSDHRLIILCEVQADFGSIPFWFYHSWISLEGFDAMVEQTWSKRLSDVQASDLERRVSRDEIRLAVWNCGENKSPGPDGYSCNSSFVALIPKITDAKFVNDFRPISLIGSVYKVVTKVLADRLALVILNLISDTQSAFVANRQILDGSFILNELLHWCKRKKKQVLFFKVDFAKAYDSIRWDYLLDVMEAFGFGNIWCKWIRGTFSSAKASVLVNGSPTIEFPFHCRLKQEDPLSLYLFIRIMESFNMSFTRGFDKGVFKGVHLHGSTSIFHLFYADDVMFIGEWSDDNLKGVMVGECMSRHNAWASTVDKLRSRLSKWKEKTLFIGGRLTILKAILGASPLYNMCIFKVPKGILNSMEAIRSKFFNGMEPSTNKITWAAWNKVLASKENGGLGVSSYHALNRALLFKWVWRFISQDGSLWFHVIKALYETSIDSHPVNLSSNWCSIIRELHLLVGKRLSYCKKRIRNGRDTCFWYDNWLGDKPLKDLFLRLLAIELNKEVTVADKVQGVVSSSFRRPYRPLLTGLLCCMVPCRISLYPNKITMEFLYLFVIISTALQRDDSFIAVAMWDRALHFHHFFAGAREYGHLRLESDSFP